MPDCSIVAKCRDIFGELGWIPNFNVVKSKNNTKRHPHYREYFDAPRDYHNEFIVGAKTSDPQASLFDTKLSKMSRTQS
jgi:hypothetical protein